MHKNTMSILDNNWNKVDRELGSSTEIRVSSMVESQYIESTTENISDVYVNRTIDEELYKIFVDSPYFEKYNNSVKKVEKKEIPGLWLYFRDELRKNVKTINTVQIIYAVAEFFNLDYVLLYNDIISISDKSEILETMQNIYGYDSELKCNKLF